MLAAGRFAFGLMLVVALQSSVADARQWFKAKTVGDQTYPLTMLSKEDPTAVVKAKKAMSRAKALTVSCGTSTCVDLVITLDGNPEGNDRKAWVEIMEHFADGVWEATEGEHKLRNIRIYRGGANASNADIFWREPTSSPGVNDWPSVPNGGGVLAGRGINMFASGRTGNITRDFFTDREKAGYTAAHEMGHYFYGVYDEYSLRKVLDISLDDEVEPSIMNLQERATAANGSDKRWLNFSVRETCFVLDFSCTNDFENEGGNEQMRKLRASAWEVLARDPADDPDLDAQRRAHSKNIALAPRMHHPELADVAPQGNAKPVINLPNNSTRQHLYYLNANGDVATPVPAGDARSELRVIWMDASNDNEIVIVLDRSSSMTTTMMAQAKQAAKSLVDQLNNASRVAIVSFSSTVTTNQALTLLDSETARTAVKAKIDTITASGSTAIGDAAQVALNLLLNSGLNGTNRSVFLLSDGMNNAGVNPLSVVPAYQNAQIPLFTFAYGTSADTALLQQMASLTGGRYYFAPTTSSEIVDAFQSAGAIASAMPGLFDGTNNLASGQTQTKSFSVDPSVSQLIISVTHAGAAGASVVELIDPNGAVHVPTETIAGSSETTKFFRMVSPVVGTWQLRTQAVGAALDYRYTAKVSTEGMSFHASLNTATGEQTSAMGRPVKMLLTLSSGEPITGLHARIRLIEPDGSALEHDFTDDGVAPDDVASDGVYTVEFWPGAPGAYRVIAEVSNPNQTGRYTSVGALMAPLPDGSSPEGGLGALVTENFNRSVVMDLQVTANYALALEAPDLNFTSSGAQPWSVDNTNSTSGGSSARSGVIGHNQSSTLQTTVQGPGTGRFNWKVGSEGCCDYVRFYIDDVEQASLSGTEDWQAHNFVVGDGVHTLKWVYDKDGSVATSPDAAWVDQVTYLRDMPFADVPVGSWAAKYISKLYHAGITKGCADSAYCPGNSVNRQQMAAFLVRALEGEPSRRLCEQGDPFSDVQLNNLFCNYVKSLSDMGITTGCGNGNYCPTGTVNRQQMAAFIVRALEGEPALNYCGSTNPFADVPHTSPMCRYIKRLAELGVTTGCGGGNFCPNGVVTREQMAAFLARAFLGM